MKLCNLQLSCQQNLEDVVKSKSSCLWNTYVTYLFSFAYGKKGTEDFIEN